MRLLVVQTARVGDLVLTEPLLRALAQRRERPEITLVTSRAGDELLADLPGVERRLVLDKRWNASGSVSFVRVLRELRAVGIDVAVTAHRSFRSGLLVRGSGAGLRIGFRGAAGAWAYNRKLPWDPRAHAVDRYLALATPLGVQAGEVDAAPRLPVAEEARRGVDRLLAEAGVGPGEALLCMAPGSTTATKRWLPERFAELAAGARGFGLLPVLVGASAERALGARIVRESRAAALDLTGRTSLRELVALLARARALVANDSGAAHIAAAVGTPVLSIFGPTVPEMGYTPRGALLRVAEPPALDCRPCHRHGPPRCPRGHFRCMREISVAQVRGELERLLGSTAERREVLGYPRGS